MKKTGKREALNLLFSAFLILGYIVCSYFFLTAAASVEALAPYINLAIFFVFGLVIFYATRVGEGKPVMRFSLFTLLILDIPALYIILAQFIEKLPFHTAIANLGTTTPLPYSPLFILACVALGYGIPYTFISGFEMAEDNALIEAEAEETAQVSACNCTECGCYVVADAECEGALMVVDDMDLQFDSEKEIRISDVTPCNDEIKAGMFVIFKTNCE